MATNKKYKVIILKIVVLIFVILLTLVWYYSCVYNEPEGRFIPREWKTKYTKEEHIDRIRDISISIFQKEFDNDEIEDLFVDVVYSFKEENPEYFLVEVKFKKEFTIELKKTGYYYDTIKHTSNYIHFLGYIYNDTYTATYYSEGFNFGKSSYTFFGYREAKKYYGDTSQAVFNGNDIILLHRCSDVSVPEMHSLFHTDSQNCKIGEVVKEEDIKNLAPKEYVQDNIYSSYSYEQWKYAKSKYKLD